ncbi:hypothetical protein pdam_00022388 [Pocillopora damicornis]|uniref:Uncharacterized protein n=1 Tax=Pocillopora damicornis TaxID=46731 RepID=A0A3M6TIG6_POCDA|nr:hypothetical protein pdam_00022388 [Pocillopora damicornis]
MIAVRTPEVHNCNIYLQELRNIDGARNSTSSQRNEVVLSSSTLSFFSDDFKSPELNYFNDKLEMNSFSNSGDKYETKRVTELMSMRVTIRPY